MVRLKTVLTVLLDETQSIQDRPEKEMLTAFSMASAMFSIFYDYSVLESAMTSTFSPLEFLENKVTLLLINPSATPDRVAPLFVALVESVVEQELISRCDSKLQLYLDPLILREIEPSIRKTLTQKFSL